MSYRLNLEEMEAAFRRAAHRALYGTRGERSGRFLPRKPVDAADETQKEPQNERKPEPAHRPRG